MTVMDEIADRLTEKIHALTPDQIAEVERFVESLQDWGCDRLKAQSISLLSVPSFEAVWNNSEDEAYDAL